MLNNTFSQSTRSQPQGLDRAKHSITTPEKLASQFYLIAKPEGSPIVYHSITTWPPGSLSTHHAFNHTRWEYGREEKSNKLLDHYLMTSTRSHHSIAGSLDHSISSSLETTRSQGGVPEAQFDQWHTREGHFSPSDANDILDRRVLTWRLLSI